MSVLPTVNHHELSTKSRRTIPGPQQTQTLHGTAINAYIDPFSTTPMQVNMPVPWSVWEKEVHPKTAVHLNPVHFPPPFRPPENHRQPCQGNRMWRRMMSSRLGFDQSVGLRDWVNLPVPIGHTYNGRCSFCVCVLVCLLLICFT